MDLIEKTLSSEYIYRGKVIDVKRDEVILSDNTKSIREVVEHSGGVTVLAMDNNNVLLVKQYRYPIGTESIELPAGKLEINELPDIAAKRELEEETGYVSDEWINLGFIYTSVGYSSEKLHIYLAKNAYYKKEMPDDGEILIQEKYPLNEVINMIDKGIIKDSKTICAIMKARKYLNYD